MTDLTMDDFLRFVQERHRIWEQRQAGAPQPWTDDPILASRKFTNVFRVLDPGTQFLLTDVFDPELSPRDNLMRAFLYRHTGRVETWEWLDVVAMGSYPTVETLDLTGQLWRSYRTGKVPFFTGAYKVSPQEHHNPVKPKMFTDAYLVFPQSATPGTDKVDSIIDLTKRLFTPGSPEDIMPDWEKARTQAERFNVLHRNKGVGNFMSMQILTDWGYQCGEDREDEFLVPGPGSIKGAKALDPTAKTMDVVKRVVREVRGLADGPRLGYRRPSLMDIGSNLLCEWSKYVRFRGQPLPTKTYTPAHPGTQPAPVLPDYYTEDVL
jgi:hypothetical protein